MLEGDAPTGRRLVRRPRRRRARPGRAEPRRGSSGAAARP